MPSVRQTYTYYISGGRLPKHEVQYLNVFFPGTKVLNFYLGYPIYKPRKSPKQKGILSETGWNSIND